ncbi:hypothetical protein KY337_05155 [Candidatus Woesearchaeota archaeon]|nr:hypothetical protein [Candidatus Woesearchaeota archaeon]
MKRAVDEIIDRTRALSNLKSIILYDKDLYFLSEEPNPDYFKEKVEEAIYGIKHDYKINIINVHHHSSELMRDLMRHGKLIFGSIILSDAKFSLKPYYLFSYDLTQLSKSDKVKVSKRIHGSEAKIKGKTYKYEGLKSLQGNELVSNSTMLVSQENYDGFRLFLEEHNVKHSVKRIWIE